MAEIRINATGGVKLYDADDSHYAQIVAGTITSNVDAITLGHDTVTIADNLSLGSDSAVLKFGADGDTTLTHTDGTGLTLNSTNKICFNDASQFIQGSSNAVLSLGATDEIDLTATAVDLNGTLNVSGVATFQATPVFPDGSLALADLDIDGGTDIGAALVDADEIIVDDGGGGTNRRCDMSRVKTYIGAASAMNDLSDVSMDITNFADSLLIQTDTDGSAPGTGTLSSASNNIGIGKDVFAALTSGSNNVAIGNGNMDACTTGNTNVSIGSGAHGALTTAYNSTAVGYNALAALETGYYNTAVGHTALKVCTGNYNTAVGHNSLITVTSGGHNTGLGWQTLNVTTGQWNTAVGSQCLQANTSGNYNVAMGHLALDANTTASNNVAIGYQAAGANTTGARITAIGDEAYDAADTEVDNLAIGYDAMGGAVAGGEYNIAIGNYCLDALTSADHNIAIGYSAGTALTTGSGNTMVGLNAGDTITDGTQNTLIGYQCDTSATGSTSQLCFGYQVTGAGDNNVTIGNGDTNRIYNNFNSNATWTRSSDVRIKKDIKTNEDCGLDFINDLRTVTFKKKAPSELPVDFKDYDPDKTEPSVKNKLYGFIAQEVKEVLDKHNITDFNGWNMALPSQNSIQGISYEMFVIPLIKSVQELSAQVTTLQDEIKTLKGG